MFKSSEEWYKEIIDFVVIMDFDGWDRRHFKDSWNEYINKNEFVSRVLKSTIQLKNMEKWKQWQNPEYYQYVKQQEAFEATEDLK